jgi:hypothetical protein
VDAFAPAGRGVGVGIGDLEMTLYGGWSESTLGTDRDAFSR